MSNHPNVRVSVYLQENLDLLCAILRSLQKLRLFAMSDEIRVFLSVADWLKVVCSCVLGSANCFMYGGIF